MDHGPCTAVATPLQRSCKGISGGFFGGHQGQARATRSGEVEVYKVEEMRLRQGDRIDELMHAAPTVRVVGPQRSPFHGDARSHCIVHICTSNMTGDEFVRRIRRLGRERGIPVRFEVRKGKGSHGRLYFGDRFATIKDRRKEIGGGLLEAMLWRG